ncbi:MAG: hypothetical protein Q9162_001011 [Coniocarpon cinnabarinum]
MPGILPMKVIKVGSSAQARIAQACDRCRSKKIRCDGFRPSCTQCTNVGFECKTSDKLSRRAFPRGYTESLEERVRALELEIRELKDLLDAKDDKIDMLSKLHSPSHATFSGSRRPSSKQSPSSPATALESLEEEPSQSFRMHQDPVLHAGDHHDPRFTSQSNSCALLEAVKTKAQEVDRPCPDFDIDQLAPTTCPKVGAASRPVVKPSSHGPSRLISDQMVNVYFQEWAPLLPVLHRPSFLKLYEQFVSNSSAFDDVAELIQLHLVFGISATSNKTRISYSTSEITSYWLNVLDASARKNSMVNLQCLLLALMFCTQTGDWARVLQYKERSVGMACFLGLHQSQKRFGYDVLTSETRKKVFWSLYALDCFVSASLVDVDDEYISEQGIQPLLPGEYTKLSSALCIFTGARILSKVLTELYPSHATYEISMTTVSHLQEELDAWTDTLPRHLQMQFTDEKPSTHVISSRCPLLSLTYHYTRSLIHRPAACFAPNDLSSASIVALGTSSKHIIQLVALLDERNLAFSFPLNKDELLITAGAGILLQSLNLHPESKLLKDGQKTITSVLDMMKRRKATAYSEFRRLSGALVFFNLGRRSPGSRNSSNEDLQAKRDLQRLTSQFPASQASEQMYRTSGESSRSTLAVMPAPSNMTTSASATATASTSAGGKRFRPIAPSNASPRSSNEFSSFDNTSPRMSTSSRPPQQMHQPPRTMSVASVSASSSTVNLDFFPFPADAPQSRARLPPAQHHTSDTSEWETILGALSNDQLNLNSGVHDWNTLNGYMPLPQQDSHTTPQAHQFPKPTQATSIHSTVSASESDWAVNTGSIYQTTTNTTNDTSGYPANSGNGKTQSLLSLSDDSGEEFSSLDWGTSSAEDVDAFKIMMETLGSEGLGPDGSAVAWDDRPK